MLDVAQHHVRAPGRPLIHVRVGAGADECSGLASICVMHTSISEPALQPGRVVMPNSRGRLRHPLRSSHTQFHACLWCRYEKGATPERFPSSAGPPTAWGTLIPTSGTLYFDYLSYKRAPAAAAPLTDDLLLSLLVACGLKFVADNPQLPEGALQPPAGAVVTGAAAAGGVLGLQWTLCSCPVGRYTSQVGTAASWCLPLYCGHASLLWACAQARPCSEHVHGVCAVTVAKQSLHCTVDVQCRSSGQAPCTSGGPASAASGLLQHRWHGRCRASARCQIAWRCWWPPGLAA